MPTGIPKTEGLRDPAQGPAPLLGANAPDQLQSPPLATQPWSEIESNVSGSEDVALGPLGGGPTGYGIMQEEVEGAPPPAPLLAPPSPSPAMETDEPVASPVEAPAVEVMPAAPASPLANLPPGGPAPGSPVRSTRGDYANHWIIKPLSDRVGVMNAHARAVAKAAAKAKAKSKASQQQRPPHAAQANQLPPGPGADGPGGGRGRRRNRRPSRQPQDAGDLPPPQPHPQQRPPRKNSVVRDHGGERFEVTAMGYLWVLPPTGTTVSKDPIDKPQYPLFGPFGTIDTGTPGAHIGSMRDQVPHGHAAGTTQVLTCLP